MGTGILSSHSLLRINYYSVNLKTRVRKLQGGQNFFEQIRTKIRTFSEEIRTIRTIFEKKSVQFFF